MKFVLLAFRGPVTVTQFATTDPKNSVGLVYPDPCPISTLAFGANMVMRCLPFNEKVVLGGFVGEPDEGPEPGPL